ANIFGLEPNYGCCTANMHQGWPKFTSHLWMRTPDDGLAAMAYAPCTLETSVKGKPIRIETRTNYPFDDEVSLTIKAKAPVRFPLLLRVPAWAKPTLVVIDWSNAPGDMSGTIEVLKSGTLHRLDMEWKDNTSISFTLSGLVKIRRGYHDSVAIERGPLVYALKIGSDWKLLKGKPPFADWEVYPTTPWNYALQLNVEIPEKSITFTKRAVGDRPFSPEGAPIEAKLKGRRIAD